MDKELLLKDLNDFELDLFGIPFRIQVVSEQSSPDIQGYKGKIHPDQGIIKLQEDLPFEELKRTLLHEIIHGILKASCLDQVYPADKDEFVTEILANFLFLFIKSNQSFFKRIFF